MDLTWLHDLPPFNKDELSREARLGLGAARHMHDAKYVGNDFGYGVRELASHHSRDERTIRRWIRKAHDELTREPRFCKEKQCGARLPLGARTSRRYCDQHAGNAARVQRHRHPAKTRRARN